MDEHTAGTEHIASARKLAPLLAAAAPRIDAARELPPDVLDAMHAAGMFRLLVPRSLGGAELDPSGISSTISPAHRVWTACNATIAAKCHMIPSGVMGFAFFSAQKQVVHSG